MNKQRLEVKRRIDKESVPSKIGPKQSRRVQQLLEKFGKHPRKIEKKGKL
jgi:hypothetical protein